MNKTMTKLTELEKKVVDTKAAAYSYDTAFFSSSYDLVVAKAWAEAVTEAAARARAEVERIEAEIAQLEQDND